MLEAHDRSAVEVFCYSDAARPDATTERIRALGHAWRDVAGLKDERVEALVLGDRIDVLVELAGHTANNRLRLMARRPAPVLVTYLGYPATTGLSAIDWRITDDFTDPPACAAGGEDAGKGEGGPDAHYAERLMRLEGCPWCYRAAGPDEQLPGVGELPASSRGYVTFTAPNRVLKATPAAVGLWAAVLRAVPNSRLLVRGGERDQGVRAALAGYGIDPSRVRVVGRVSRLEYFRLLGEADVCLDGFPYAGTTTTCDALWMGLPVVTLAGRTHASRVGMTLLHNVGLPELAAQTPAQYVQAAARLAADLPLVSALRAGMRHRLQRSPLMDAAGLARKLERAYRLMWDRWRGAGEAMTERAT